MNPKQTPSKSDLSERFTASFEGLRTHVGIGSGTTPFIWAIAVLLIVIFTAFYLNVRANNETILRTNLMKSTGRVADNIDLKLTDITATMARLIEILENSGPNSTIFKESSQQILAAHPEIALIRLIEANGKGIDAVTNPRFENRALRRYNYLDYPKPVRDSIQEAIEDNKVVTSTFWFSPGHSASPSIVIAFPFKIDNTHYAVLSRIALPKLLEDSIPNSLRNDYAFSLLHGTEEIVGKGAYNPPDDYTIPSYVRGAEPLPPSIQLYGCTIVESPLIFASPLLLWLGGLMLFLLVSLFFLNKEMRRNQNALEAARRELFLRRSIEESTTLGMIITDMNSTIVYANSWMRELTGYSPEELEGKEAPYPFWADDQPLPADLYHRGQLALEDLPLRSDVRYRKKNGEMIEGLLLATPYKSPDGDNLGWMYLMRDNSVTYTAMCLTNDALASYKKLIDTSLACISVVSNKPSGPLLGIRNERYTEELGNTVDGHVAISKTLSSDFDANGHREGEVWVPELDRWFNVTENRLKMTGGSAVTLQSALDITRRKNNEKALEEQTSRMESSSRLITLGEMASTITHEINQPLTAITAYANTALEVLGGNSPVNQQRMLDVFGKIATQAGRIDKIIKNIRSFAKRRPTSLEQTPLAQVINDTTELGQLIEKKYSNVRIVYKMPRTLPFVDCDAVQIVQILLNLIRNAADALTEAGSPDRTITVKVELRGDEAILSVADRGPGISPTMKASLFTPFFSTKKNGLGLGLSTCQTIAEAHNTKLKVDDNPLGGTIFSFSLKTVPPKTAA